jgi:hypothetical protein
MTELELRAVYSSRFLWLLPPLPHPGRVQSLEAGRYYRKMSGHFPFAFAKPEILDAGPHDADAARDLAAGAPAPVGSGTAAAPTGSGGIR